MKARIDRLVIGQNLLSIGGDEGEKVGKNWRESERDFERVIVNDLSSFFLFRLLFRFAFICLLRVLCNKFVCLFSCYVFEDVKNICCKKSGVYLMYYKKYVMHIE